MSERGARELLRQEVKDEKRQDITEKQPEERYKHGFKKTLRESESSEKRKKERGQVRNKLDRNKNRKRLCQGQLK